MNTTDIGLSHPHVYVWYCKYFVSGFLASMFTRIICCVFSADFNLCIIHFWWQFYQFRRRRLPRIETLSVFNRINEWWWQAFCVSSFWVAAEINETLIQDAPINRFIGSPLDGVCLWEREHNRLKRRTLRFWNILVSTILQFNIIICGIRRY